MGSASKITSGVLWSLIVNLVNSVYGFISVPILIHYFGKTEYGIIGLAMSVNVYMQLMDMGFNSTNIRFFSVWLVKKNFQKASKLFQTSLAFYGIIGIFNGVILLGISLFSKEIFHLNADQDEILKTLFYVLIISAIISWYSSCFDQGNRECSMDTEKDFATQGFAGDCSVYNNICKIEYLLVFRTYHLFDVCHIAPVCQ